MSEYEKGFIECFIDTDGFISIHKRAKKNNSVYVRVGFCNNSKEILDKIKKMLGTNKNYSEKKNKINSKINYEFRLPSRESEALLSKINLVVKEEKRKLAIEIRNLTKRGNNQFNNNNKKLDELLEINKSL